MQCVKEDLHICRTPAEILAKLLLAFGQQKTCPVMMVTPPSVLCEAAARSILVLFFFVQTLLQYDERGIGEERVGQQESAMSTSNEFDPASNLLFRRRYSAPKS
jgi:hypothetical protein